MHEQVRPCQALYSIIVYWDNWQMHGYNRMIPGFLFYLLSQILMQLWLTKFQFWLLLLEFYIVKNTLIFHILLSWCFYFQSGLYDVVKKFSSWTLVFCIWFCTLCQVNPFRYLVWHKMWRCFLQSWQLKQRIAWTFELVIDYPLEKQ